MFSGNFEIINCQRSHRIEKIYVSALILAVVGIATAILVLQIQGHFSLGDKAIVPITTYTIAAALVAIHLVALALQRRSLGKLNPPVMALVEPLKQEEVEVVEAKIIEYDEESEGEGVFLNPLKDLQTNQSVQLQQQRAELKRGAKEQLKKAKGVVAEVDWRQFALMNNTFLIIGSRFEGHQTFKCIQAYLNYLEFLEKEGCFFTIVKSDKMIKEVEKTLKDTQSILSQFLFPVKGMIDAEVLKKLSAHILQEIEIQIEQKGFVYFPIGYCGAGEGPGHALACKIISSVDDPYIVITILNLGEGVEHHPELDVTNTHIKSSYAYYPAVIPKKVWKAIAPTFMSHLFRFSLDSPLEGTRYTSRDLYDLLALFRSLSPRMIIDQAERLQASPQHVGDCPEKAARNIVIDYLTIQQEIAADDLKRMFLNLHLASLVSAYHSYQSSSPKGDHQKLIVNACEEFAIILLRSKDLLLEHEYLEAAEIINEILRGIKKRPIVQAIPPDPLNFIPPSTSFPPIKFPTPLDIYQTTTESIKHNNHKLPSFYPLMFAEQLKEVLNLEAFIRNHKTPSFSLLVYVYSLPIPQWESLEDPWDQVPKEDIDTILPLLFKLQQHSKEFVPSSLQYLSTLTIYAIADKLMRRSDEDNILQANAFPFPTSYESYLFFSNGGQEARYQDIKSYFLDSLKAAKGNIIPFPNTENVGSLSSSQTEQLIFMKVELLFKLAFEASAVTKENYYYDDINLHDFSSWDALLNFKHKDVSRLTSSRFHIFLQEFCRQHATSTTNDLFFQSQLAYLLKDLEHILKSNGQLQISKELMDGLLLLLRNPSLRMGLVIPWIERHFHELNHVVVQRVIEYCLFTPGILREQLRFHPESIGELKTIIDRRLMHHKHITQDHFSLIFLIQCGISLESYLAQILDQPIDVERIQIYKTHLKELLPSTMALGQGERIIEVCYLTALRNLQWCDHFLEINSVEDFIDLYTSVFAYRTLTGGYEPFEVGASSDKTLPFYLYHHFLKLKRFLDQQQGDENRQTSLDVICNGIVSRVVNTHYSQHWQVDFSSHSAYTDDLILRFESGEIVNQQTGKRMVQAHHDEIKNMQFKKYGINPTTKWWLAHVKNENPTMIWISFDDSIRLFVLGEGEERWRCVRRGEESQFLNVAIWSKEAHNTLYFLKYFPLAAHHILLHNADEVSILTRVNNRTDPYMRIDLSTDKVCVVRVDRGGEELPYKLANLENLDRMHPLYAYTLRFAPIDQIICFIHVTTGEIEELKFPHLNTSFKRLANKGLESEQFPGYFLVPLTVKCLKSFSQCAMILRNDEGHIKIILPIPQKEKKIFERLETEGKQEEYIDVLGKYFIFDLHSVDDPIHCQTLAQQLFLIYFFKVNGDLEEAYKTLQQLRTLVVDAKSVEILNFFLMLKDRTPLSLAFNMKLILFFVDHFHLLKKDSPLTRVNELSSYVVCWYENYLKAIGEDHIHGIPIERRLHEKEEIRILALLQANNITLSKMLGIRAELIESESRSATIDFIPQEVMLGPSAFKKVLPPNQWEYIKSLNNWNLISFDQRIKRRNVGALIAFPNQLPPNYCLYYFADLFEQARGVPEGAIVDPFDFILLAALRTAEEDSIELEIISLLVYVRYIPFLFNDCSLLQAKDDQEKRTIFNQIIYRIDAISQVPEAIESLNALVGLKTTFDYKKTTILTLPMEHKNNRPLPSLPPLPLTKKPFLSLRKQLFKGFLEPSSLADQALFDTTLLSEDNREEKIIIEQFEARAQALAQQKEKSFVLQPQCFSQVKKALIERNKTYSDEIKTSRQKILNSVNDPFNTFYGDFTLLEEREFRLRQHAHQTYDITPEMIMREAILKNRTTLFDEHRPKLREEHVQAILIEVHQYYHLLVLSRLCQEAIDLIQKLKKEPHNILWKQELLTILDYEFLLAPQDYPEIAYTKLKTGKLIRPEQAMMHKWECEQIEKGKNSSLQLSAGLGKTSYLIPLMVLRCKRYPFIPCILTTQAMYGIEKENLNATLDLLEEPLDLLEIDMHSELSLYDLQVLYQQFVSISHNQKALIMTPQAYYALRLQYFTLVSDGASDQRTDLLDKLLSFFKNHCLLLADESHRNEDPMTQAICGFGQFINLSHSEKALLLALTKPLLGIQPYTCKNGTSLSEIAGSKERGQGKPSRVEMALIQQELASYIMETFFADIPTSEHPTITTFLLNKSGQEPIHLSHLEGNQRHLILLARYFLTSLLKRMVKMKTDFDHILSSEQGEIESPAHYKTPSHAQFKDPYLTFVLTMKGTWYRGLNESQFYTLMEHLKQQESDEQTITLGAFQTPTQQRFEAWTGLTSKVEHIDLANKEQINLLFNQLKKEPAVVEYYLTTLVLSKIGSPSQQFTSTPSHLIDGFKCSLSFSATPLPEEAYPSAIKAFHYDQDFEVRVLAQSSKPENQQFIFPESIKDFFTHLSENKHSLGHVCYMVDLGGLLSCRDNKMVAEQWLFASDLDGVVYFQAGKSTFEERLCLCLKEPAIEIEFVKQQDLVKNLANQFNLHMKDFKIGFFLDAAHAESAHFDPKPNTAAFLLVGDSLTLSHAIQGIMRERGFLNQEINQRLIWVVQKKLKAKMKGGSSSFNSRHIHTWCLINEVKARKESIIMASFQKIALKIEKFSLVDSALCSAIKQHPKGFREEHMPCATGEAKKALAQTDIVLWTFAKNVYKRFNFSTPLDQNIKLQKQIAKIINRVHKQFAQIIVDFQQNATSQMHQKSIVKKQIRLVQYQHNLTALSSEPIKSHETIASPHYPINRAEYTTSIQEIFKTPFLTNDFYIETNQIRTAQQLGISLGKNFLKPIDFLLIVIHGEQMWAEAIANDVLPDYVNALRSGLKDKTIEHKAFIIRSDGVLYQRGRGVFKIGQAQIRDILNSEWVANLLIDVALLQGKIIYNQRFKERIEQWPNFFEFWKRILQAQPYKKEISIEALLSHLSCVLEETFV